MTEETLLKPIKNRPAALIIGVNHYNEFDESIEMEPGFSNLQGCINDTKVYYNLARRMGAPPENIRVITSAPITPEFLGEGADRAKLVGRAYASDINEGLRWLVEILRQEGRPVGFVSFCGHGDYLDDEQMLVLCAQDTRAYWDADSKTMVLRDGIVRMPDVREPFTGENINLTYFLDVCYASGEFESSVLYQNKVYLDKIGMIERLRQSPEQLEVNVQASRGQPKSAGPSRYLPLVEPILYTRSRCLTRRPLLTRPKLTKNSPEVLLVASDLGKPSYEFNFNGVWNGAFTRVIQDLMDRWNHPEDSGAAAYYITNEELLHRADLMLRAMNFDQSPSYVGIDALRNNRVLARENSTLRFTGVVRAARKHELSPGNGSLGYRYYHLERLVNSAWQVLGSVVVVGSKNVTLPGGALLKANQSYWTWTTAPFSGTFALRPDPTGVASTANTAVYTNAAFPSTSSLYNNVPINHHISLNGTRVGELTLGAGSPPASLTYYMIVGTGQIPPFFDVVDGDRLVFTPAAGTVTINAWRQVDVKV